jgi:hypothetical protein
LLIWQTEWSYKVNKKISKKNSLLAQGDTKRIQTLCKKVTEHIDVARHNVQTTVDSEMVRAYWLIGRDIVEEEQKGKKRAEYGSLLLDSLSTFLTNKYGKGFSVSTLRDIRQFYLTYHDYYPIHHAVRGESKKQLSSNLGWILLQTLISSIYPQNKN